MTKSSNRSNSKANNKSTTKTTNKSNNTRSRGKARIMTPKAGVSVNRRKFENGCEGLVFNR